MLLLRPLRFFEEFVRLLTLGVRSRLKHGENKYMDT
jgi:hypothetical protein